MILSQSEIETSDLVANQKPFLMERGDTIYPNSKPIGLKIIYIFILIKPEVVFLYFRSVWETFS